MKFRWLLLLSLSLALGLASLTEARAGGKKSKHPNIVFIFSDDHASAAISSYGSWLKDTLPTPNLDKLASQGVRFTQCLVTNSICTPSRAVILTGEYSHRNGVLTLSDSMDPNRRHLAHLLSAAGYQTAIFGKWHLGTDPQGFDSWNILVGGKVGGKGRPGQGRYHDPIMRAKGGKNEVHKGYSTDVITTMSLDWLKKRDKNKPFLLMCQYKAPHRPWDPAERYKDLFKGKKIPEPPTLLTDYKNNSKAALNARMRIGEHMNPRDLGLKKMPADKKGVELRRWAYQIYMKRYLACIKAVDDNVGRVLDYLEQEGLNDNTLVIYASDQGFFLGEHGWFDKRFMWEPCLTTPLIVRFPGRIPPGQVNNKMVMNLDFAPTMLDYAGVKVPNKMQGKSLRAMLEGKAPKNWRTSMYYRYYMHLAHHWVPAHYGVRNERYTLIYYYGEPLGTKGSVNKPTPPEWELFDRQKDPNQTRNYYNDPQYAAVVRELKRELWRLKEEAGDAQGPLPKDVN